jgi:hypothetical protein
MFDCMMPIALLVAWNVWGFVVPNLWATSIHWDA